MSGGPDSMAILDFLRRGKKNLTVLHYNHGTLFAKEAERIVSDYCFKHNIDLIIDRLIEEPPPGESLENFWRKFRYNFFEKSTFLPIITCHHLDDAVENWLFTSLHGNPMMIPLARDQFIRPFLATSKDVLVDWCDRKDVPYILDPSNNDVSFMRNYIRHQLMPQVLHVNPGLKKVIKKKICRLQKLLPVVVYN